MGWNRWVTLSASGYSMLCAAPMFTFGAIHSDIRKVLHATEFEVQLIGTAGDVGLWTKIFPGIVFDRYGARATVATGSVLAALGYALMYMALVHTWAPSVAALAWFIAGQGSAFIYTGALFGSIKNFAPAERGFVTGVLACLFGTGSTVFGSLLGGCLGGELTAKKVCVGGWVGGSVTSYMLLLSIAVPLITALAALVTHQREGWPVGPGDHAKGRFRALFIGIVGLILWISGKNTAELFIDVSIKKWANYVIFAVLAMLLAVPVGAKPAGKPDATEQAVESPAPTAGQSVPVQGREVQERPAMCQPLFWVFFLVFGICVGADLMTLNILSSLAKSRGFDVNVGRFLVVLQMGCDTLARLSSGFSAGAGVPLGWLVLCAPIASLVGQVLLALGHTPAMYVAVCLLGISDGLMWTLGPHIVGKTFGLAKVGVNFGVTVLSASAFQVLLSLVVEPQVYKHNSLPGEEVCVGHACFAATFWITAALAAFAVALAAWLLVKLSPPARALAFKTEAEAMNECTSSSTATLEEVQETENKASV